MTARIDELADALAQEGVAAAFGVPGSGLSWQLITALASRNVSFVGARHEGAGAIMAGAFARRTGSLGCAITIKGPGIANATPGMVSNRYEQWPVISIAEAFGPNTPAYRMHKRLDHFALMSPIAKACASLGSPRATIAELATIAKAEAPGPVHLDLFAEPAPRREDHHAALPAATEQLAARHLDLLRAARRPVVIVGSLATRRAWGARLTALRIPVFTTTAAKGVLDERLPHAAGVYTGDGKALAPESVVLPQADLVVGLGLRNVEVLVPKRMPAPLLWLDAAGESAAEGFEAVERIPAASDQVFAQALDVLAEASWGGEAVAEAIDAVRAHLVTDAWLPGRALATLEAALSESTCLTTDTGSFCTVIEHVWRAKRSEGFFASANGRYMGTGIPMALGTSLARRDEVSVCVLGDGGMMYAAELKLAVEQRLPILFLLMSDGRYGSIVAGASAPGLDMRAVTMAQPSWWRAVEGLGLATAVVRSNADLERILGAWSPGDGPLFVEATFDPEPYAAMTNRIR